MHFGLDFGRILDELLPVLFEPRSSTPLAPFNGNAKAAQARSTRADCDRKHQIHVDVHGATQAVIYSGPGCRRNVWCWYIAPDVEKNESNAHFVAVHAFQVDVERHELRAETHNLHGNDSSGLQFLQGLVLSL